MKWLVVLMAPAVLLTGGSRYARLGAFEGPVEVQLTAADVWIPAERNLPLPEGAWLRSGAAGRVEVEFDDGSALRLAADSQCEISDYTTLSTGQRITLVSLDHGLAYFTRPPGVRDGTSVVLPGMQVMLTRAARVRLEAATQSSEVSVLDGTVRFSSPAAEIDLLPGQTSRVEPELPNRFFLDRAIAERELDKWSADRDKPLEASPSGGHVVERYGVADLDAAGHWIQTDEFGAVWKPAAAEGWVPFQKGRWVWYDGLGYTWVAGESWGWLPYHYGRWAHAAELGWVWVPSLSQVFKPGEVYWLAAKDATFVAWGPLAPGEPYVVAEPSRQFAEAYLAFARYTPGSRTIDPAGFGARPKEVLAQASYVAALGSPAMAASRLDAARPQARAGSTHVDTVVKGVTFASPQRVVEKEVDTVYVPVPTPAPAPEPEQVAVPVAVPYPVIAGVIAVPPNRGKRSGGTAAVLSGAAGRRPKDPGEVEIYNQVLKDEHAPSKELQDLDFWSKRYPDSDFRNDRTVLYLQVLDRLGQGSRVVMLGAPLVRGDVKAAFPDPAAGPVQILNVLYLVVKNGGAAEDKGAVKLAARQLLAYIPVFFAEARRPANVTEADWSAIAAHMARLARASLR